MGRLLFIKSIEGRVLAGITMFVGMMILIGWVAINEEARMQAFVRQHTGRSIERGAELFASLCSECHGEEGYGADERAPGLNNPHLFGYDPVGLQTAAITNANRALVRLNKDIESLSNEMIDPENPPSEERQNEILAEIADLETQINEQQLAIEAAVAQRIEILGALSQAWGENGLFPLWDTVVDQRQNRRQRGGSLLQQQRHAPGPGGLGRRSARLHYYDLDPWSAGQRACLSQQHGAWRLGRRRPGAVLCGRMKLKTWRNISSIGTRAALGRPKISALWPNMASRWPMAPCRPDRNRKRSGTMCWASWRAGKPTRSWVARQAANCSMTLGLAARIAIATGHRRRDTVGTVARIQNEPFGRGALCRLYG